MSDWPAVTVLVVTYDRPAEIRRTMRALLEHASYPGELWWLVADDGSPDGYLAAVKADFPGLVLTTSVTDRAGWGGNVNAAMAAAFERTSYVFLVEDDYVARRRVDLGQGVALLEAVPEVGLVRYDGVAAHSLDLRLREAKPTLAGRLDYMLIDPASPHLNVYSNRPHLKHRRFHEFYGEYLEAVALGRTEEEFAHRVKRSKKGPALALLDDGVRRAFDHVGESRQGTDLDPCRKGKKE